MREQRFTRAVARNGSKMRKLGLMALVLGPGLVMAAGLVAAEERTMQWPPTFVHAKVATTPGGYHATTRGTIRLVFPHQGKWLVFRGRPDTYHFSQDGVTWTATEAPQAGRSHLIIGDTIYSRYDVLLEGDPAWLFDQELLVDPDGEVLTTAPDYAAMFTNELLES